MEHSQNPLLDGLAELEEISKKWSTVKNSSGFSEAQTSKKAESLISKDTTPSSSKALKKAEKRAGKADINEGIENKAEICAKMLSNESELSNKTNFTDREFETKDFKTKVKSHFPQIIDEDTEQFKIKLEHLLNLFKNDAINEFMVMKKGLLEEQVKTIKKETEKYLKMYEQKYEENENNKATLSNKIKENEDLTKKFQSIRDNFIKNKQSCSDKLKLAKMFDTWKYLRDSNKTKKRTMEFANHFSKFRLVKSQFNTWKSTFQLEKKIRNDEAIAQEHMLEIEQISAKFNKEIEQLTNKLKETQGLLNEANNNQLNMQENLKRAFVRGVCALNFEAMNVLQTGKSGTGKDQSLVPNEFLANTENFSQRAENVSMNLASKEYSSLIINPLDIRQPSLAVKKNLDNDEVGLREENDELMKKKKIMIIQNPSLESKEYKWKQAPLVGVINENSCGPVNESIEDNEIEKPRYDASSTIGSAFKFAETGGLKERRDGLNTLNDDKKLMAQTIRKSFVSEEEAHDEGKVIKVNNGKSFITNTSNVGKSNTKVKDENNTMSKTVMGKSIGKSDAKINTNLKVTTGAPSTSYEKKSSKIK